MSVTVITPFQLVEDTASDDLPDAGGTVATTPSDGFSIAIGTRGTPQRLLIKVLVDGTGDTLTILAGDKPPAERAGLGNLAVVLAASDVRFIMLDSARFMQDDNTIKATCVDAGTSLMCFLLPVGWGGGSGIA